MDERVCDAMREGAPFKSSDMVPSELTRILALGCRLARLVKTSPMEPHIKALATEFIERANKATSNVQD